MRDRNKRTDVERKDADAREDDRDVYSIQATESPADDDRPPVKSKSKVRRYRPRRASKFDGFLGDSPGSVTPSGATYQPSEEDPSDKSSDTRNSEALEDSGSDESDAHNDVSTAKNDSQSTSNTSKSPSLSRRQASTEPHHHLPTGRKAKKPPGPGLCAKNLTR